jgi:hypothetical protein
MVGYRLVGTSKKQSKFDLSEIERKGSSEDIATVHTFMGAQTEQQNVGLPRASSLYSACIRMQVLGTLNKAVKKERLTPAQQATFGLGRAIHWWAQNTKEIFGDNRYGWWRCLACGTRQGFGPPRQRNCRRCGASPRAFLYDEFHLETSHPYPMTGHPDMFRLASPGLLRVWEIKSIDKDAFKTLIAPSIEYTWQIQAYMWASSKAEDLPVTIDPYVGYVLYISKGMTGGYPFKCFVVKRDKFILKEIKEKLRTYYAGVKTRKIPPPLGKCSSSNFGSYDARKCPCLELCKEALDG